MFSIILFVNESVHSVETILYFYRFRGRNIVHIKLNKSVFVIQVGHMFRGCKSEDMPAHIYSVAQSAYRGVLASRRDHSIVFLGHSGSGKTTNYRHTLHYLALAAGSVNKVFVEPFQFCHNFEVTFCLFL